MDGVVEGNNVGKERVRYRENWAMKEMRDRGKD